MVYLLIVFETNELNYIDDESEAEITFTTPPNSMPFSTGAIVVFSREITHLVQQIKFFHLEAMPPWNFLSS